MDFSACKKFMSVYGIVSGTLFLIAEVIVLSELQHDLASIE